MNQATAPVPTVKAEFHVEPHPDPVVRSLIAEVERLRSLAESQEFRAQQAEAKLALLEPIGGR